MIFKTKNEIEIEFNRAYHQAEELEKIANDLSSIANADVENAINILAGNFKGDNGTLFIQKGGDYSQDIFDVADELLKVARNIRSTADLIYKAEKAAINKVLF